MKKLCVDCCLAIMKEEKHGLNEVDKFYCDKGNFTGLNASKESKKYCVSGNLDKNPKSVEDCTDFEPMSCSDEEQKRYLVDLRKDYKPYSSKKRILV